MSPKRLRRLIECLDTLVYLHEVLADNPKTAAAARDIALAIGALSERIKDVV